MYHSFHLEATQQAEAQICMNACYLSSYAMCCSNLRLVDVLALLTTNEKSDIKLPSPFRNSPVGILN